jgi:hypothetical protein
MCITNYKESLSRWPSVLVIVDHLAVKIDKAFLAKTASMEAVAA